MNKIDKLDNNFWGSEEYKDAFSNIFCWAFAYSILFTGEYMRVLYVKSEERQNYNRNFIEL